MSILAVAVIAATLSFNKNTEPADS